MTDIDWSKIISDAEFAGTLIGEQLPVFYKNVTRNSYEYHYPLEGGWSGKVIGQPLCAPLIPRTAQAWNGEGLPPVGAVCMAGCERVVIVAHHCNGIHAIYAESESDGLLYYGEPNEFRPIRTPEQIAADERDESVISVFRLSQENGWDIQSDAADYLYFLYDSGLLKKAS